MLAEEECLGILHRSFPEPFTDPSVDIFYFHPTRASWRQGDHEIVCVALYLDGARTGSLPGLDSRPAAAAGAEPKVHAPPAR